MIVGPAQPFHAHFGDIGLYYGPALMASLLLLPLMIVDVIRFSNRFVGPLVRLRRSMRELARGECVGPIEFRDADFWQEIAEEFNAVRDRVQTSATAAQADHEEEKEPAAIG